MITSCLTSVGQLGREFLVGCCHVLAVSAPRGEELDQNQRELIDGILKGLVSEDKDVAFNLIFVADSVVVVVPIMTVLMVMVVIMLMIMIVMVMTSDQRYCQQA